MRAELRIIKMTQSEHEAALKQFLGNDYESEKDNYWDHAMDDFKEVFQNGMEIAEETTLQTQYYAVLIDPEHNFQPIDERLYELPEAFSPELFEGFEDIYDEDLDR